MNTSGFADIFKTFAQMGFVAIGSGHAIIPLVEREFVKQRESFSAEDFTDLLTLAESTPGAFSVNLSIAVGHKLCGYKGSIAAALGMAMPTLIVMVLAAALFSTCGQSDWLRKFLIGMRPAIIALTAVTCFRLGKAAKINLANIWLPLGCIFAVVFLHITPVFIIAAVAICAYLYGMFIKPLDNNDE